MDKQKSAKTISYFAAANGYSGFRSYFDVVFDPRKFLKLYVLKGGPGTGKSSLMKSVYNFFKDKADTLELIYCSSDIRSLDGVIIRTDKGCVGILDGTAPHAVDPRYPGCIDEIINLGEYWNTSKLNSKRSRIEELVKKKTNAYKKAYTFLSIAGKCESEINKEVIKAYKDTDALNHSYTSVDNCKLIDSFGKDGVLEMDSLSHFASKTIGIVGIWGCGAQYLKTLTSMYSSDDIVVFPSVFSDSKIKAVYIKSEDTLYVSNPSESTKIDDTIDVSHLIDLKKLESEQGYLEDLHRIRENLLWHSQDEFKKASTAHFELEEIYKSAMDFSMLNTVKENLYTKIGDFLF